MSNVSSHLKVGPSPLNPGAFIQALGLVQTTSQLEKLKAHYALNGANISLDWKQNIEAAIARTEIEVAQKNAERAEAKLANIHNDSE